MIPDCDLHVGGSFHPNCNNCIGRLLAAIAAAGQTDNTIVIFTSDNGGLATAEGSPTCNAPLSEGKGWMYEGGTREPLLVRMPGLADSGSLCSEPVTSPDFYPTLLEIAGLPMRPTQHSDGVSFAPLLRGDERFESPTRNEDTQSARREPTTPGSPFLGSARARSRKQQKK